MSESIIAQKSFDFSVKLVKVIKEIRKNSKEYELTGQLLRSGTSIGANVSEAKRAQSTKDFISKMSIASKEANESLYWIRLMIATDYFDSETGKELFSNADELVRILTSIVKTASQKQ